MNNKRIALYCNFESCQNRVFSNALVGNPGIGGTQYLFILLFCLLLKEGYNVTLFSSYHFELGEASLNERIIKVNCFRDVVEQCDKLGMNVLIIRDQDVQRIKSLKFRTDTIIWAHNPIDRKNDRLIHKADFIKRVVCVSEQQAINMGGYRCSKKVSFINNCCGVGDKKNIPSADCRNEDNALYVGAFVPQKGTLESIEVWKRVIKKRPHARLYLVGGLQLRGGRKDKSKYCSRLLKATKNYSDNFVFTGVLNSQEVFELSKKCKVGLVNLSHYLRDETFCLSAVELQSYGLPVISRKRFDGLETSLGGSQTGSLLKKDSNIVSKIIEYLDTFSNETIKKSIDWANHFNQKTFIDNWKKIINEELGSGDTKRGAICRFAEYHKINIDKIKILLNKIYERI